MRFLWFFVSSFGLLLACGGSAFTGQPDGQAGSGGAAAGGQANHAGAGSGGDAGDSPGGAPDAGASSGGAAMGGAGASSGGAAMGGAGASSGGASAGTAGAADEPDSSCPKATPKFGRACVTGLACSYGDDPRPACRAHYQCTNGRWPAPPPVAACPALSDCMTTPSGFPVVGNACKAVGEECTFDGGGSGTIYCRCSFCGTAMSCPPEMADWACAGPPPSPCPDALPNEGQACLKKQSCFYGVPCEGAEMVCDGKTWKQDAGGCAN